MGYTKTANPSARDQIIEVLKAIPHSTTPDMMQLLPDLTPSNIYSTTHAMLKLGLIIKSGKAQIKCSNGLPRTINTYALNPDGRAPKPTPMKRKKPTNAGYEARIAAFQVQIAELEAWKADAIARFPDLAVPPVTIRARRLVAAEVRAGGDNALADQIIAGLKDTTLMVRVAVKALEDA